VDIAAFAADSERHGIRGLANEKACKIRPLHVDLSLIPTSRKTGEKWGTPRDSLADYPFTIQILAERKSALDLSVQDASAALPQNCQTTRRY
jgi:hypothetical protein